MDPIQLTKSMDFTSLNLIQHYFHYHFLLLKWLVNSHSLQNRKKHLTERKFHYYDHYLNFHYSFFHHKTFKFRYYHLSQLVLAEKSIKTFHHHQIYFSWHHHSHRHLRHPFSSWLIHSFYSFFNHSESHPNESKHLKVYFILNLI